MNALDLTVLALQLLMPAAFVAWLALRRPADPVFVALEALVGVLYLAAITLSGLWLPLPRITPAVLLFLLAAAVARDVRRLRRPARGGARRGAGGRRAVGLGLRGAAAVTASAVTLLSAGGRAPFREEPLDLALPLEGGPYLVAAGGSALWRNPHLKTRAEPRFRDYRGQSYAVDLVGIGSWGSRSWPPFTGALEGYAIFGARVLAPCRGTVVQRADGRPDARAEEKGTGSPLGNHVVIDCDGTWVVLAHLKEGSVQVAPGDALAAGDPVGLVGNSGRSDEPHLHVHAQRPGTEDAPLSGEPVPVLIDGRHLVRNDRVNAPRSGT